MTFGVETVGNYNIDRMNNGKYAVSVNNGNLGAVLVDAAAIEAFKDKYSKADDKVSFSNKDNSKNINSQKKVSNLERMGWGLSSFFLPGFGQIFNRGEYAKGIALAAAGLACEIGAFAFPPLAILGTGIVAYSAYDAYKNAK
ncbi:hypothetical protein IJE86_02350 [bacterium]|nr:hypothetical protein [bacterium]